MATELTNSQTSSIEQHEQDSGAMFIALIKLANTAKTIGEYELSNAIFAVLLSKYLGLNRGERDPEDRPPIASLMWETEDQGGWYPSEVHFDLLTIEAIEWPTLDGAPKYFSTCIPAPLLNQDAAITALKASDIVWRKEHRRGHREAQYGEVESLRANFMALAGKDAIEDAVNRFLADEVTYEWLA